MSHWDDICAHIASASGTPCLTTHLVPVSGGYTSHVWHLSCDDGRELLVKLNSADKAAMYAAEGAGLQALAGSHTITVPRVICHGVTTTHTFLVIEFFDLHDHGDARLLGTQLAAMHRVYGQQFGWEHDNTLGLTPQHNTWCDDWLTFWREQRLGFQLELAAHNGFRGRLQTLGEQVMARLPELLGEHRPAPSLLHGDLWGGNHAYLADGRPVIFDPATYYGDREADLAMTELFGGFAPAFYAAYHAACPLDAGYARRKTLYNLYHVLNHCNMIGSSYVAQAEGMMQRLLEGLRG